MTPQEVAKVVARIQAGDNRTVDQVTLAHWGETIGHLPFADALEAVVMHFRENAAYLMPAHVLSNAARIADARNPSNDTTPGGYRELHTRRPAPTPDNLDALTAAWNNPREWATQMEAYNTQLRAEGHETLPLTIPRNRGDGRYDTNNHGGF